MIPPVICLITDRQRLAAALTLRGRREAFDAVVEQVSAASRAGVELVQVRERDLDGRQLFDLVSRCVAAVRGTSTRIVVNDRLDVAMAAGAHGLHLRETSFDAPSVRAIAPRQFLVGRSIHDVEGARRGDREGGLDYLVFGPVFSTDSKPGVQAAGLDRLAAVAGATALPVLAVGGVTGGCVEAVTRAGAAGVAAIGLFAGAATDMAGAVIALRGHGATESRR